MKSRTSPRQPRLLAFLLAATAAPLGALAYAVSPQAWMTEAVLSSAAFLVAPSVYVAPAVGIAPGVVVPGGIGH